MRFKSFGTGTGLGVFSAILFVLPSALFSRWGSNTSLVNFDPAIVGVGLLAIEIALALISLILGCIWLARQRWKRAGFALAFSIIVIGYHLRMWLWT